MGDADSTLHPVLTGPHLIDCALDEGDSECGLVVCSVQGRCSQHALQIHHPALLMAGTCYQSRERAAASSLRPGLQNNRSAQLSEKGGGAASARFGYAPVATALHDLAAGKRCRKGTTAAGQHGPCAHTRKSKCTASKCCHAPVTAAQHDVAAGRRCREGDTTAEQ